MRCPRCQADNREGARFCRECGALFGVICSSCGASVQAGSKFCDSCGTPLAAAPRPEPERPRPDGPQAASAEDVVEVAGPSKGPAEAERRQLTVLFCDLVGSTQLSGQLDPEDLRAVVRAYQEAAAAVIHQYAGHIAQYLGDGLLVYFGYPTAHEDDARRAVHTGLGIVEAVADLNTRLMGQYAVELAVRLGIHTGPVVVGVMGGGERHEHLALGETPNIAARLEALAPANAVVISPVTARLVRVTFALEDAGTHTLKGIAEPMTITRVRGLLATPSPDEEFVTPAVPALHRHLSSPSRSSSPRVPSRSVLIEPAVDPEWILARRSAAVSPPIAAL